MMTKPSRRYETPTIPAAGLLVIFSLFVILLNPVSLFTLGALLGLLLAFLGCLTIWAVSFLLLFLLLFLLSFLALLVFFFLVLLLGLLVPFWWVQGMALAASHLLVGHVGLAGE